MNWVLRILLILVILRILWRLFMGPLRRPRHERNGKRSVPLVRDPVCGTYLLPDRAVKTGAGDALLHFCSETCRAKYHDGARP